MWGKMFKRNFVILVVVLFSVSIFTSCSVSEQSEDDLIQGISYYISFSEGDDTNSGDNPDQPWKTFANASKMIFNPGDKVLLKRGDVWDNNKIYVISEHYSGTPVIVSSYGEGENPQVSKSSITAGYVRFDRENIDLTEDIVVETETDPNEHLKWYESTGEIPISHGKKVTTSNEHIDYSGSLAVDGDMETFWCTEDSMFPSWLKVDLGESYNISKINQHFYTPDNWKYIIEVSEDDENYSIIVDESEDGITGHDHTHEVDAVGRYVRITIIMSNGNWATSKEFRIYGSTLS